MGFTEEAFLFVFLPIFLLITLATNRIGKMWVRNAVCVILSLAFYAWPGYPGTDVHCGDLRLFYGSHCRGVS